MRWLARAALAALGSVVSVFIACAYGVPYRFVKTGRVVDATIAQGIPGIRVGCVVGGAVHESGSSDPEGRFALEIESTCDALAFDDVDGAQNGAYVSKALPFIEGDERDLLVELDPSPP
jgi:hypothetical protein